MGENVITGVTKTATDKSETYENERENAGLAVKVNVKKIGNPYNSGDYLTFLDADLKHAKSSQQRVRIQTVETKNPRVENDFLLCII